jgi:hypothetical protein
MSTYTVILRRQTVDGRTRRLVRLVSATPVSTSTIRRRRTAEGRTRRLVRLVSTTPVSTNLPVTLESLSGELRVARAPAEWRALELHSVGILVEWLEQANKVVADEASSIEWSALPAPVRVSLERLLASPGKRRLLSAPGRSVL